MRHLRKHQYSAYRIRKFRQPAELCGGKIKYDKRGAVTAKNLRMREDRVSLRIYECPRCEKWHLTSLLEWNN